MSTRTLLAATALTAAASQAGAVELTLSHWVPATHPLHETGMEPWVESIEEASNGEITIDIYPSQQLGAAPDHYDMARDGITDIGFINPGYQPGRFPILAAGELPFLMSDGKGGSQALHEWYQDYAEQEMSDVFVCLVHVHDPGTLHAVSGPLQVPGDIAGKTVRPAHATMASMVNQLGGSSVQVPAPEMREILERGTADMTASPWNSIYTFGVEDVVSHHLDMPFYTTVFAFVINQGVMDGLSEENRQVMEDHCTPEWSQRMTAGWVDAEAAGRQRLIDDGHTLYAPDEAEREEWQEAVAPLSDAWIENVSEQAGIDGQAAYDALIEKLREHDALVE